MTECTVVGWLWVGEDLNKLVGMGVIKLGEI